MPDRELAVGSTDDFPEGQLVWRKVPSLGLSVIICRLKGVCYAVENKCSHQERPMEGAKREYQEIRCPHHGVCYDLRDGSVRWTQGFIGLIPLKSYKIEERTGQVFLIVPQEQSIY